jgi:hypothetical protein
MRVELETRKDASELNKVIRVFRAYEKVKIHEPRSSGHVESYLDVWKKELNVWKAAGRPVSKNLFIRVGYVVVGYGYRSDSGCAVFERGEVRSPGGTVTELIVYDRSGCVDVRLPPPPLRASIDHEPSLCATRTPCGNQERRVSITIINSASANLAFLSTVSARGVLIGNDKPAWLLSFPQRVSRLDYQKKTD